MKRLLCFLLIFVTAVFSACSFVEQSVGSFVMSSFDYNGNTYTRAHDWNIDADVTDYRADTVTADGVDYDIRVYGGDDDFIYMVISGDVYHNNAAAFPSNTVGGIAQIDAIYDNTTITAKDEESIQRLCDLLDSSDYSTEALKDSRYLCSYCVSYKDCPAYCSLGAIVGVGDKYFLRCDCVGGEDISDKPRYYPVPADFI